MDNRLLLREPTALERREIATRFLGLKFSDKRLIVKQLGLAEPGDERLGSREQFASTIGRAQERGLLWDVLSLTITTAVAKAGT